MIKKDNFKRSSDYSPTSYANDPGYPIKIVALGGLDEMGKNCYVLEIDNDVFIIEAGLKYPSVSMPGVDIIIPDFDYVKSIAHRVKGIIITHGHDDQYGALPYLLTIVRAPIYATETTIAIIKAACSPKFRKIDQYAFIAVKPSDTVTISGHVFEFFQTSHSVAESFGFAVKTRFGNIVYTSDFASDYSALKGYQFDLPKVARLSEENETFLLLTESETANKPGIASPAHKITPHILKAIEDQQGKLFISVYTQNFYNIQEIVNVAIKHKKHIIFADDSEERFFEHMIRMGSIDLPDNVRASRSDIAKLNPRDVIILVTGSGEKLFNLCKEICYGTINYIKVETTDTWIDAAPSVAGTEVAYTAAADTIFKTDCNVITLGRKTLAAMHAQQEDLKMMISLFRPKYYMPVKGEYRLLMENAKLAIDLNIGLNHFNTFVYDNGMVLAFDVNGNVSRKYVTVKSGDVMVDGNSVGEVKETAISERQEMADGGVLLIGVAVSFNEGKVVAAPDIQMRGFLYMSESDELTQTITNKVQNAVNDLMQYREERDISEADIEKRIENSVSKAVTKQTMKDPVVICHVFNVDDLEAFDAR